MVGETESERYARLRRFDRARGIYGLGAVDYLQSEAGGDLLENVNG